METKGTGVVSVALPVSIEKVKSYKIFDYLELTKPGINFMVLITTALGFYIGGNGVVDTLLLIHTIIGTALVVGGASAINMYYERDIDAKMQRTQNRPLPAGRLQPYQAQIFGVALFVAGALHFLFFVNATTLLFATLSFINYVFIYTPLKRKSSLCIPIGAISGAIPPIIGCVATGNAIDIKAIIIFSLLFLWQFPHFLALSWMYREDFKRANLPMLSVIDPDGSTTVRQAILYTVATVLVSFAPLVLGITNFYYFLFASVLGMSFLVFAVYFVVDKTDLSARRLFFASIAYLPMMLGLFAFSL